MALRPSSEKLRPLRRRRPREEREPGLVAVVRRQSPGLLIAATSHLVLLGLLSCWTLARVLSEPEPVIVVTLGAPREHVALGDPGAAAAVAAGAATTDPSEVDLDGALHEALGRTEGLESAATGAAAIVGVGGGGGGGTGGGGGLGRGGLKRGSATVGGASLASDAAILRGLDWLARHRSKDGGWAKLEHHRGAFTIDEESDAGATGLALLCFLCADRGPWTPGRHQEAARSGLRWLVGATGRDGRVAGQAAGYLPPVALMAMAEALARGPQGPEEDPLLREAVTRVAGLLVSNQHAQGGWRYQPNTPGDTSVTSWTLLALRAASHAGARVPDETWTRARSFVEAISRPDGRATYTVLDDELPGSPAMLATGLFLRVLQGEEATTQRNQLAIRSCARDARSMAGLDGYTNYYCALALHQVGGDAREALDTVRDALVSAQGRMGCEHGAWTSETYGPVIDTAFAVLTLETYYRYLPAGLGERPTPIPDLGEPELCLVEAATVYDEAKASGNPARVALARERYRETIVALEAAGGARGAALADEAWEHLGDPEVLAARRKAEEERQRRELERQRVDTVLAAARAGDGDAFLARADAYLAAPAEGLPVDLRVVRLRRELLTGAALELDLRAAEGAEQAIARALDACALEARVAPVTSGVTDARIALERGRAALARASDPRLDEGMVAYMGSPTDGPVLVGEATLADAVARRALRAYAVDERFELAESDASWLELRALPERLGLADRARWARTAAALGLARIVGLARLRRDDEALAAVAAFREAFQAPASPQLEAVELLVLARRDLTGRARGADLERLVELGRARVLAPADDVIAAGTGPWAQLGGLLLARGHVVEARTCLARVRAGKNVTREEAFRAQLLAAGLARVAGSLDEAQGWLDQLGDSDRADVRLERCALLRAQAKPSEASAGYRILIRALSDERPAAWWDAIEGLSLCALELRQTREARELLLVVSRRDPTFGGDKARAERLHKLMIKLGAR